MKPRCILRSHKAPPVASVFRVCDIAKRSRLYRATYFVLILAASGKHCIAAAGPQAADPSCGDLVRVRGRVVQQENQPIPIAGSLSPVVGCADGARRSRHPAAIDRDAVAKEG
jgi:hypothetical protein